MTHPWRDPAWLAVAHAWIDEQVHRLGLVRLGDIEQPHVYPWSTVLRVPTALGDVWFKANAPELQHEAALVTLVAERVPERVPPLLAVDVDRGWMLMADAGRRLREVVAEERSLHRWLDVLPATARIQLAMEPDVEALLALGVPDMRLATLPDGYERLMDTVRAEPRFRAAHARVVELCEELATFGITETLQHDDLHDGQVFLRDGTHLVMDWGDACISHPFFTLSVTVEGGIAWGVDDVADSEDTGPYVRAYLAPYAERYDGDLPAAARVATRLGWACRAVNGHVPSDVEHTLTRLRMFVDGRI
ncbi:MAG TPA: phosphotransferase [Candidatus Nanopelagicales bacterium]|nr:phosphotransferase [Candidatus Nanopelagicales bacterium]